MAAYYTKKLIEKSSATSAVIAATFIPFPLSSSIFITLSPSTALLALLLESYQYTEIIEKLSIASIKDLSISVPSQTLFPVSSRASSKPLSLYVTSFSPAFTFKKSEKPFSLVFYVLLYRRSPPYIITDQLFKKFKSL